MHRKQPRQRFDSSSRGGTEATGYPEGSSPLDFSQDLDHPSDLCAPEVPQSQPIGEYGDDACTVQESLLHGGDSPGRVAQHSKGLHRGECLSGVKPDVLLEQELPIKEEPKIPLGDLGPERGCTSIWCISQIDSRVQEPLCTGEVKGLRLVMFQDQAKGRERHLDISIGFLE